MVVVAANAPTSHHNRIHPSSRHTFIYYFSTNTQLERYFLKFFNRNILEPKYLDYDIYEEENFECCNILTNIELLDFITLKEQHFPELLRVFYIHSEVKKVPLTTTSSLFFSLTKLPNEGVSFEGIMVNDWKDDYSIDVRTVICNQNANIVSRLLVGSMKVDSEIMHYIICRILLPCATNLSIGN